MTEFLDLTPPGAVAGLHRVDDDGHIAGLSAHRGERFLLVRMPEGLDDLQRGAQGWADDVARRAAENRPALEDEAAKLARQWNLDETRARDVVRRVVTGVEDAARLAPKGPAAAVQSAADSAHEARRSLEKMQGVPEELRVPESAPSFVRREAEDELRAVRQAARAAKATEEHRPPTWKPGAGTP